MKKMHLITTTEKYEKLALPYKLKLEQSDYDRKVCFEYATGMLTFEMIVA